MTGWICDACGQKITSAKDGWVEWLENGVEGLKARGLRLVHHRPSSPRAYGCQYNDKETFKETRLMVSDLGLEFMVSHDGLMRLLSFLSRDEFLNKEEVLEMIKRLHIPGYETGRHHFDAAIAEGVFEPNTPEGYYHQFQIKATNEWVEKAGR